MLDSSFEQRVTAVRRFSRFYTRQIGLLQDGLLDTPFSLTQARVLYELAQQQTCTATELAAALGLDHGYLSRILRLFDERGLVAKRRGNEDGRQVVLSLTTKGRLAIAKLDQLSQHEMGTMLGKLGETEQIRVVAAMDTIERLIGPNTDDAPAFLLREHRPGDMGWVVARHGALYPAEYGWDNHIEALTAEIVAGFLKNFDPARERCWIAEMDGEPVGSIFLVRDSDAVARVRLLIVDPKARGLGIGRRLVEEAIAFARTAGYSSITLWTHKVLTAARMIYVKAGFKLVEEWVHDEFGKPETSETWQLDLRGDSSSGGR
ncbi:bifunctional helix-turn-helix transcriptional regulator/GNAT family N-acetyltransferase [Pseudorhodoplanes sinuspersici]|uniref:MarR family transcriptional regulator n=1 Tax=Pseudorhodoplanes sinuspersici TaxID=1235591 RepID=A0A1W6ZQQ3_9HYPH|nr:helix-turn-helix domain-containing GNAT family N-acetyltransferase [Pseudorhodoplanes sinuspersici]ARP99587.1 MarR family transcriptional regulator [Pseudorhodoplanes sinuspersici]RKE70559.1 MarR family transcriptional regulator with acetyltransferase activity [Pseudorhodoplanes sinuspersici]